MATDSDPGPDLVSIAPTGDPPAGRESDADASRGCSNLKLRQLTRRVSRDFDGWIAASGLKTTQYSLLSCVVRLGPARPGDIAAALGMDASTLTRNLQPLIANGWVWVGPGTDGRSRQVVATEPGRAKRIEARRAWRSAQAAFVERLGSERVDRLHALIEECMALLDAPVARTGTTVASSPRCKPSK